MGNEQVFHLCQTGGGLLLRPVHGVQRSDGSPQQCPGQQDGWILVRHQDRGHFGDGRQLCQPQEQHRLHRHP